jgi:pilus assembly protein CpaF
MDTDELRRAVERGLWTLMTQNALTTDVDVAATVSWIAHREARGTGLTEPDVVAIQERILWELRQYGPLWGPMFDPEVSEIMVNGPSKVFIEKAGKIHLTDITFKTNGHLTSLIERLVAIDTSARLDSSKPMVDVALPDGSRMNAIMAPVVNGGDHLTIRKYQRTFRSMDDLVAADMLDERMATLLVAATRARLNILFSGGAGTGKTTLVEVLSRAIPSEERVICIEDTMEIHFDHINVVRMLTRIANIEGKGEITIGDLFRNSLRMCPDRVILGEIRGKEAFDYLQALNSGHSGSLAVLHASSPDEAVLRLQNLVPLAGLGVPPSVVTRQIAHGVHLIAQVSQLADGSRRVVRLSEVAGIDPSGAVVVRDLFRFRTQAASVEEVRGAYEATGVVPSWADQLAFSGVDLPPDLFAEGASKRAPTSASAPVTAPID